MILLIINGISKIIVQSSPFSDTPSSHRKRGTDHRNGNAIDRREGSAGASDAPLAARDGQRSQTQEQPEDEMLPLNSVDWWLISVVL